VQGVPRRVVFFVRRACCPPPPLRLGGHFIDLPTTLLVPASPGEFDPACANATSTAPACSLLAPWSRAADASTWSGAYFPAGYAASLWKPAGAAEWFAMRWGTNVSRVYAGVTNNVTYAGNMLYEFESTLEGFNQVPFYGLSDRLWAIPGTVDVALPDLLFNDWAVGAHRVPIDGGPHKVPTDGYQQGSEYWINDNTRIKGARMFAHAAASDRRRGPAGVVMVSTDYGAVLRGDCVQRLYVPSTNKPNDSPYAIHRGEYCVNEDACPYGINTPEPTGHPLRFSCADHIQFALQCNIWPQQWLRTVFPNATTAAYAAPITVQCPAYPYMWGTVVGFKNGKPYYPRCGLSSAGANAPYRLIQFDGESGTDSTCCFEQTRDGQDTCEDLPSHKTNNYMQPSCNR